MSFSRISISAVAAAVVVVVTMVWWNEPVAKTEKRLELALEELKANDPEADLETELSQKDGWKKPLQGEIKVTSEIITYTARSAGPDGEFNTDDDMIAKYEKKFRARIAARWVTEGLKGAAGGVYEGIVGKDDGKCDYCQHGKEQCGAESLDGGYICTREEGHDGKHIACTDEEHEVKEWKDPSGKPWWKVW